MIDEDWASLASRLSGCLSEAGPPPERGVLQTGFPGVSAVFVPHGDLARLRDALLAARVHVLGLGSRSGSAAVAVVMCDEPATLKDIVNGGT